MTLGGENLGDDGLNLSRLLRRYLELNHEPLPSREWLVGNWMPADPVAYLSGIGGGGQEQASPPAGRRRRQWRRRNGGGLMTLGGENLGDDGVDLVRRLRKYLEQHPEDQAAWAAAHDVGQPMTDGKLKYWTWSGQEEPPPRAWLVDDWMPAGRVSYLSGIGGAGKSRLGLQLAAGLTSGGGEGDIWLGGPMGLVTRTLRLGNAVPTDGVAVVYATWEDDEEEFARRLSEISGPEAPWVTPERVQQLYVVNLAEHGPVWAPGEGRHISTVAGLTETGRMLRDLVVTVGGQLLILDPLAAAYSGDENARGLVRQFVADWDGWGRRVGCAVLLVAHPPKSGEAHSGSTDWRAAVRSMWVMRHELRGKPPKRGDPDERTREWCLNLEKSNYGAPAQPLWIRMDSGGKGLRWEIAGLWDEDAVTNTGENYDEFH